MNRVYYSWLPCYFIIKVEVLKMAATQKTREKFIGLRAENVSFDKIAKQLKVSKSTLITWSKIYELDIQNLRAITHEALNERWSGRQDLNLRPRGPKPRTLPNCATPRFTEVNYTGV